MIYNKNSLLFKPTNELRVNNEINIDFLLRNVSSHNFLHILPNMFKVLFFIDFDSQIDFNTTQGKLNSVDLTNIFVLFHVWLNKIVHVVLYFFIVAYGVFDPILELDEHLFMYVIKRHFIYCRLYLLYVTFNSG